MTFSRVMVAVGMLGVAGISLVSASCAEPLQKIADDHRQERIEKTYANQPVTTGAADGLGTYSADAAHGSTTISADTDHSR